MDPLQKKFSDRNFSGQVNYEDLMRYLHQSKEVLASQQRDEERMEQQQSEFEERMNRRKNQGNRPESTK